jgi:RNA polymerase sigma-70 factor (ECF subfamily)
MDTATMNDGDDTIPLLRQGAAGDQHAVGELWHRYRERLKRIIRLRLDRRLPGRLRQVLENTPGFFDVKP